MQLLDTISDKESIGLPSSQSFDAGRHSKIRFREIGDQASQSVT